MKPQPSLFGVDESANDQTSYRLTRLEVFNWGPFANRHQVEFDEGGTAIIGPTGSGKTTLVDALMTLLVMQPKYNLASTGGHESDRTLVSYVRGVLGGDGSDGREEVARPGKTITGICATYLSGEQELRLAALFWTDGTSNAAGDLKRRFVFSTAADQTLEKWLRTLHEDGIRELMKLGREVAGLRIVESKKQYLAHTRKFFDVGENAFTLLNRAAGLKQLNSIDEIFRELVLDDHAAFDRAQEVAAEFDNLAAIHQELETARRQRDALEPVEREEQARQKLAKKTSQLRLLRQITPIWYALQAQRLWQAEQTRLEDDLETARRTLAKIQQDETACEKLVETLKESYLKVGGGLVEQLEETIGLQSLEVERREKHVRDYVSLLQPFGLSDVIDAETLQQNQAALKEEAEQTSQQHGAQHSTALKSHARVATLQQSRDTLKADLKKVKERPHSNLPPRQQDFRDELARELKLEREDVPFLAELIEVKPDQSAWRGAIERAIGAERLRVLVPQQQLPSALRWVNNRDNRLHVRLQGIDPQPSRANFFDDSYAHKCNFRDHPYREAVRNLVANRDYHCVDSPEELRQTEHALTREGMMSGRKGRFEKQDQRALSEGWMTGFDNQAQLRQLLSLCEQTEAELQQANATAAAEGKRLRELEERGRVIEHLLSLDFATIDLPAAQSVVAASQARLAELLDPESDASQAKDRYDAENKRWRELRDAASHQQAEMRVWQSKVVDCKSAIADAAAVCADGLTDEQQRLAERNIKLPDDLAPQKLDAHQRNYLKLVNNESEKHAGKVNEQRERLIRCMEAALRVDSGALADIGSELDDVPHYLERLAVLRKEALPEKLSRFLDYLNRSSDQGVTQLLAGIEQQVDQIEHRIASLNQTLLKVDFRGGRYLQLQPQRLQDERKRALDAALRHLRSAALKTDEGESHFAALQNVVNILRNAADNRRQVGSRALLDPRYRLNFFVVEVDRETGNQSPRRTGSQSGSGGEKELMASHILTASLSYALCPAEATRPLYASVILDEAFSKSSPSAASRIIEALRVFGLHPIFVTPNKEIRLLRRHTKKVICVQRLGQQSSVASIRWEELDAMASARLDPESTES